jgi:hypothetical protein
VFGGVASICDSEGTREGGSGWNGIERIAASNICWAGAFGSEEFDLGWRWGEGAVRIGRVVGHLLVMGRWGNDACVSSRVCV